MGLVVATLIVIVVIASIIAQEPAVFSWAYWQQGGGGASRSEIFRNFGLLAAALVGLGFGVWRAITAYLQTQASQRQADAANEQAVAAIEQAHIAQQGHVTERFSRAVEHLGSENLSVRLGGIYALWRLITDSPEDVLRVLDVLCAFVRHPPPEPAGQQEPNAGEAGQGIEDEVSSKHNLRPDVQAVLNLIGDAEAIYRQHLPADYRLDLGSANLTNANLTGANLRRADLMTAVLVGAILWKGDLTRAFLWGADLTGAVLWDADLTGANLTGANLSRASLWDANVGDASPQGTILKGAILLKADLTGADLTGANFDGAVNIPDLSLAYADPNFPPKGLPEDVKRPEPWEPCPEK